MRIKSLFLSMLVGMAFVGCSSEKELNGGGTDPVKGGTGYVAVNIVQPKTVGTRATGDFENGDAAENNASEGLFFIFDASGKVHNVNGKLSQRIKLAGSGTTQSPAVERIYSAILLIDGVTTNPTDGAKQIVCILNAPEGLETGVTKLSDLQAKVEDYCTGKTEDGKFVMSNSVYYDGDNPIVATPVEASKVKNSASAALTDPVDIYVERVVAKVRAKEKSSGITNNVVKITVDGVEHSYTIHIDGIALSNRSDKAYLLKSLTGYSNDKWTWNDKTNFRSFWEVMPGKKDGTDQVTVQKVSWNDIQENKDGHYNAEATPGSYCFTQYILPNTFEKTGDNTSIMVAAHLTETVDGTIKKADLVWIRGGYTTDNGALKVIASAVQTKFAYYKKTGESSYKELESSDFEWEGETGVGYSCYAQLKTKFGTDNKIYKFTGETPAEVTDGVSEVNTYLSTKANSLYARKYTDGKSYYFVEIEHVAAGSGETATPAINGIVRNHIYDLTLNSIAGPGIPVFNPDDKNIPQEPEDENLYFLGARVNVLDWRIVSQGVEFDNGIKK
ncbi:Mfa1 family fimbria major subunit [Prevotella copri]|uniref:Mfa1 family fimbria major subunit n=1 Tax=Segatella copri TaxID=165179 RepID=A0AAP3FCK7_9BACT|nr:Mfa1 family fimbria major subunit [Segatella copri]MCW4129036.1 Mfa1 family fimbria major subunit [Segatella copri]